jgi:hypothetical protein
LLSTDSGQSFPTTLLAGTANDGSATVLLPSIASTTARIKVQPVGNVYFDMSNVDFTIQAPPISIAVTSSVPGQMAPGAALTVQAFIADGFENVVGGSETLYYRNNGGAYQTLSMSSIGGDTFEATLPAAVCGDPMQFYVEAQGDGGSTRTDPSNAPTAVYSIDIGTTAVIFSDNFQTDQGWTATTSGGPTSGNWQRGVPVNDPGWDYDPVSDSDGSGQCYLTQNATGNTDVDGGTVHLMSPVIDMSSGDHSISYDYFLRLTDTDGTDRLLVEIQDLTGGAGWITIATHTTDGGLAWRSSTINQTVLDSAGVTMSNQMQLRFSANDGDAQSIVEAGLDAVSITGVDCSGGCTDSDGDGVCDPDDICPGFDDNADADGDGVPDGCDICAGDDASGDSDGDGVCDDTDACPNDNPDDSDGDGVCDSADLCPGSDDGIDTDGDGIPDGCDCTGDADGDGDTDITDLGILLANFGSAVTPGTNGDLDFSGAVDITDLGVLLADFGCAP